MTRTWTKVNDFKEILIDNTGVELGSIVRVRDDDGDYHWMCQFSNSMRRSASSHAHAKRLLESSLENR